MELNYTDFMAAIASDVLQTKYLELPTKYYLYAQDSNFVLTCTLYKDSDESTDFEANHKSGFNLEIKDQVAVSTQPAFAGKTVGSQRLFKRVHGISQAVSLGSNSIEFVVPYVTCKITGVELIGADLGDTVNFKVLDTPTGTISGYPNVQLNQFGFNVNLRPEYHSESSTYDADLIQDLKLVVEYTSVAAKDVRINFILHEVK
jgi:hypothetical protein